MKLRFTTLVAAAVIVANAGCGNSTDPAIAVTLTLSSVDGVAIPVQGRSPGGALVTIGGGNLQGTNLGPACGAAFRLAEGPLTTVDIPSCTLRPGEERTFTLTFSDARFPGGSHSYRFVP
ncbi:MAG TPA: hypothetical protein VHM24_01515 [Gemmatimonadaceae bacterium]|nr:hypothetical protein [Gemmatimonadaceae bacterium]